MIGAAALIVAGSTVELHGQRGGGAAGHGRPATAGAPAQGHGRPDNPGARGAQGEGHKPDTDRPTTEHGNHSDTDHGKDEHAKGTTGSPRAGRAVTDQLTRNTNLASRLQPLFPAGTDLQKEAEGFRNLGQFVAAAHVAHNLDIPWTDLKAKMTGDHPESLGRAIQDLKPQADAKTEAGKAQKEADTEIKDAKTKPATAS